MYVVWSEWPQYARFYIHNVPILLHFLIPLTTSCSNMPKVRWLVLYGFCSKFHTLSQSKNLNNLLRFDKVTESLKMGTFLRHSMLLLGLYQQITSEWRPLNSKTNRTI